MRRCVLLVLCMTITGCSFVDNSEQAKAISAELEATRDIVTTIETYNKFYASHCFSVHNKGTGNDNTYGVYNGGCNKAVLRELSQPEVDLGCLYKNWGTTEKYDSDECIIQRREHPADKSGFFDYSRFLPSTNNVKTNKNWLNLVKFYNDTDYCESEHSELTTHELQACREANKQATIKLATAKPMINCREAYKERFNRAIIEECHISLCMGCNDFNFVRDSVQKWGKDHLCVIDEEWDTSLSRLFYNRH